MKVAAIQADLTWCNQEDNRLKLWNQMKDAGQCDLYVLPEMFSTGFCTNDKSMAEPLNADDTCASLDWMIKCSNELDAAIVGSVALSTREGCKNRLYFVRPDGSFEYYDKRHLFSYAGEDGLFSAGEERVIVEYNGWRFLLAVCYDLRFPKWLRNGLDTNGKPEYDAMLIVASWPEKRRYAWDILIRARAIENQAYVVAVNRVGDDPSCHYSGGTAIVDYAGNAVSAPDRICELSGSLDRNELDSFRAHFPFLMDAD